MTLCGEVLPVRSPPNATNEYPAAGEAETCTELPALKNPSPLEGVVTSVPPLGGETLVVSLCCVLKLAV